MNQEDKILEKYGRDSGMRVPEGYFPSLNNKIMESLPPYQKEIRMPELSRWQRMKPYLYLAAMFCGIWLMMKIFHTATQSMIPSLDNPPEALVHILNEELEDDLQFIPSASDFDIEEEVIMSYDNIEDFEKDFGYELTPEYSSITIYPTSGKIV